MPFLNPITYYGPTSYIIKPLPATLLNPILRSNLITYQTQCYGPTRFSFPPHVMVYSAFLSNPLFLRSIPLFYPTPYYGPTLYYFRTHVTVHPPFLFNPTLFSISFLSHLLGRSNRFFYPPTLPSIPQIYPIPLQLSNPLLYPPPILGSIRLLYPTPCHGLLRFSTHPHITGHPAILPHLMLRLKRRPVPNPVCVFILFFYPTPYYGPFRCSIPPLVTVKYAFTSFKTLTPRLNNKPS